MGIFDALDISPTTNNADVLVSVAGPVGPLEESWGMVDPMTGLFVNAYPDNWIRVRSSLAFGIDGSGNAYADTVAATPGEEADVYVDPANATVQLLSGVDR